MNRESLSKTNEPNSFREERRITPKRPSFECLSVRYIAMTAVPNESAIIQHQNIDWAGKWDARKWRKRMHSQVVGCVTRRASHLDFSQKQSNHLDMFISIKIERKGEKKVNIILDSLWPFVFHFSSVVVVVCLCAMHKLLIPFCKIRNKNVRYATTFWFAFIVEALSLKQSKEY